MTDVHILQLIGLLYATVGFGALFNQGYYQKIFDKLLDHPSVLYTNGFIILTIGWLLITFHNTWTLDWTVAITIIGWVALTKGMFVLAFPKAFTKFARKIRPSSKYLAWQATAIFLVGVGLMCLGYFIV